MAPPPPSEGGGYGGYGEPGRPEGSDPGYGPAPADSNTGRVRLDVRPDVASIYVDDEFWGNARDTKSIILRAGRHSVEVVRPGFQTSRHDVDVVRGGTTELVVELERP
jgi:hypothetical protein